MVRAILAGTKGQTRRAMKPQPEPIPKGVPQMARCDGSGYWWASSKTQSMVSMEDARSFSPYGVVGDMLYVKETFSVCPACHTVNFAATVNDRRESRGKVFGCCSGCDAEVSQWKPSIFMPRKLSRISLRITSVRVQRLQEISEEDARAEGVEVLEMRDEFSCELMRKTGKQIPHYKYYGKELERLKQQTSRAVWSYQSLWELINGGGSWDANHWVWAISFERVESLTPSVAPATTS